MWLGYMTIVSVYLPTFYLSKHGIKPTNVSEIFAVIKGKFYASNSLSHSWETFTPPHSGVSIAKLLH